MHSPVLIALLSAASLGAAYGDKTSALATNLFSLRALSQRHLVAPAPTCALQSNLDFLGNDIASVPAIAARECCAKCSAQVGCKAFTWTNYKGGMCWLKSTKGANVVTKAGAQSAEVTAPASPPVAPPSPPTASCSSIEQGVDYVANDIASVAATQATDCCALCSAHSGCGAFTWSNWNGGTCWLKSGKGATVANPGAYSSTVVRSPVSTIPVSTPALTPASTPASTPPGSGVSPTCPQLAQDIEFTGPTIGNLVASTASECCAKCTQLTGCAGFTWTSQNGGTCWFKSERGPTQALTGAVSALVTRAAGTGGSAPATPGGTCPVLDQDTDYPGADLGNFHGNSASDCCATCSQVTGCGAFTWTSQNGGTCWLKTGKGIATTVTGAVSGVLTRPLPGSSATCPQVEQNVEYTGPTIGNLVASVATDCCAKCTQLTGCAGFTWTNQNGGTCWFKSERGPTQALTGAVSALVTRAASAPVTPGGTCPIIDQDTDYPGADIGNFHGNSASDCCATCSQVTGCGAFTWTNQNGGTCWLKTGKGTATTVPGAVSGVLIKSAYP